MEEDSEVAEPPDADPLWASMTIAELKTQANHLETLSKQLKQANLQSAYDEVQDKLHLLRTYTRSRLPVCQRLDHLSSLLKRNTKAREGLEAKHAELEQQLQEVLGKLAENKEEEASLSKQLEEEKLALVPDTQVDTPVPPGASLAHIQDAVAKAKEDLTLSLGKVEPANFQVQFGPLLDQALQQVVHALAPSNSLSKPLSPEELAKAAGGDGAAATLPATEGELATALAPASAPQVSDSYGACPKLAAALPSPYSKGAGKVAAA